MLLLKSAACDSIKKKFIKEQEASRLLRSLGIKTPLSKLPLRGINKWIQDIKWME